MLVDYTVQLYGGELNLKTSGYRTPFSPRSACKSYHPGAACHGEPTGGSLKTDPKHTQRKAGFSTSVWFAPGKSIAPSGNRLASNVLTTAAKAYQEHERRATHLDNVAKVAYYSSDAPDIYWGFEHHEVYRQFPYVGLNSFANSKMKCNDRAKTNINRYTPLCRDWYTKARDNPSRDAVFGKVAIEADSGLPFVSVSQAIYKGDVANSGGEFVGVAAVSANLAYIQALLENTKFYENGNCYLFDSEGWVVYHPYLGAGKTGRVAEVASKGGDVNTEGCQYIENEDENACRVDKDFMAAFKKGVVEKHGQQGTWNGTWTHPFTGKAELWYYSFRKVRGTPYQLAERNLLPGWVVHVCISKL